MIFVDTETTGLLRPMCTNLEFQPKIIELAMIRTDMHGTVLEEFSELVDPGEEIEPIITKITGIKQADLEGKPTFKDIADLAKDFIEADEDGIMVAHNLRFDFKMMENEFARINYEVNWPENLVCTVQSSSHLSGKFQKLEALYERYKGEKANQTHRALDDVHLLISVYKELFV